MTGFHKDPELANRAELSAFLQGVEKRAYKQAAYALRNDDAALDAVQDAMLKLSVSYGERPANEYPMLFQRILQNVIYDALRRQKVRNTWTTLLSSFVGDDEQDSDNDPLDTLAGEPDEAKADTPHRQYERARTLAAIEREIERLPPRQREAFLMRYWEEMDIAETAAAMGCSEGSVKTHCSRATQTLAAALKAKGIEL
ncbi:RNA polymerase sigma factor [Aromatoleum toluclasticum]|uniref:RNA polymerase sigma factor n=1 Tax=Aromatoleum toluclasticum TaxID=92003 RepID=UPI0018DEDCCE|nr:RNA polymerase sigma factor [Aromatoleum toluclasticum]MCC4118342.1 RNA polymerase sigma factor [Aromatoleum toluclasticum]